MYTENQQISKNTVIEAVKKMDDSVFNNVALLADETFIGMENLSREEVIYAVEDSYEDEFSEFIFYLDKLGYVKFEDWNKLSNL